MEINKEGKRAKHSRESTKRTKSEYIENSNIDKFIEACKGVSQNAYYNYNKRLKLLSLPNCDTCIKSSTEPSAMSQLVENFENEVKFNMWYEALETCYYSITPTQYLPENVLMGIVEIILTWFKPELKSPSLLRYQETSLQIITANHRLTVDQLISLLNQNARQNISTKYSMGHIINKCQQILSYHFNMHPPCKSHSKIMNCYKALVIGNYVEVKGQIYSTKNDFGYTDGIIRYCFNRLEHEISAESVDDHLYSKEFIDLEYQKNIKEVGTKNHVSIQRLSWEQENFEIYEMLNRTERINRLMATLYSMVELIQFDIYESIRDKKVYDSFLYFLTHSEFLDKNATKCFKICNLAKQIMKMLAYLIHLDYPEDHIKTMSLWLNAMIEVYYFVGDDLVRDYPKNMNILSELETQFYKIIEKLPHHSIIKILERIEPSYMKYYMSRRYINENLKCYYDNIIEALHIFIKDSYWLNFPKTNEHFIPNEMNNIKANNINANDILQHLSQICKNASYKCNEEDRYFIYKKFDEECLSTSVMTQNDIIKALYISLEALLDAYNVHEVYNTIQRNAHQETIYTVTTDLLAIYKDIYKTQKNLIELLKEQEAANKLPKFLECFKIIYI